MFSTSKLSPSVTDMIRFDHSHVLVTFHQYTASSKASVKKALADTICDALEIHATLEEELFYPVLRRLNPHEPVIQKSEPEHDEMRRMIAELRATAPTDERHDNLLHELMRDVMHHVADEETVLLPEAERLLDTNRLSELGAAMTRRRLELLKPKAGRLVKNTAVGFSGSTTAIVVGLAGALMAARLVTRKSPELSSSQQH
jgi:hemerythrin superfamily protein